MLVWALLIGFVVWNDVPTVGLLLGSGIVVASGLFLLRHEARLKAIAELQSIAARAARMSQLEELKLVVERELGSAR
jgi:hypothetical protein